MFDLTLMDAGPAGLFLIAFLAATLLPLGSEAVLAALLLEGGEPVTLVAVATAGNVLGSTLNYAMGWGANRGWLSRRKPCALERAERRFRRYGRWSLLFSWVPIVGDPLTLVAGLLRVNLLWFLALVTAGKALRYVAIAVLVLRV